MRLNSLLGRFKYPVRNWYVINQLKAAVLDRPSPDHKQSILVVRLDAIGDLVLTLPLFEELRRLAPDAHIAALVSSKTASLLTACPDIDEIILYNAPKGIRSSPTKHVRFLIDFAKERLSKRNWAVALNPRWDNCVEDEAYLCYLSGATKRIAYSERVTPAKANINAGFDQLYTDAIFVKSPPAHDSDRTIGLLRHLFPSAQLVQPHIHLSEMDNSYAVEVLKANGDAETAGKLVIAFCLGASTLRKTWPVENFIELASLILKDHDATFVAVGGPNEAEPGETLVKAFPNSVINTAGKSSLTQTAAILAHTDIYIGNDTGPTHIATAVTPAVIALFNHPLSADPTHVGSPARFRPLGDHVTVIQPATPMPPCQEACLQSTSHCITNIKPVDVYAKLLKIIESA